MGGLKLLGVESVTDLGQQHARRKEELVLVFEPKNNVSTIRQ